MKLLKNHKMLFYVTHLYFDKLLLWESFVICFSTEKQIKFKKKEMHVFSHKPPMYKNKYKELTFLCYLPA